MEFGILAAFLLTKRDLPFGGTQTVGSKNRASETRCASPFDPTARTPFGPYHSGSGATARTWEEPHTFVHGVGLSRS